jgi:hypothetical protein
LNGTADFFLTCNGTVTRVTRTNPMNDSTCFPGSAPLDAHADVIDTELVSMSLDCGNNITVTAGCGLGACAPLPRSLGAIVEDPSDDTIGDSFFDVFFEVKLGVGVCLYNPTPLRVQAPICGVPPVASYEHSGTPVPLFRVGMPGTTAATLVVAQHQVPGLDDYKCLPSERSS